MPVNTEAYHRIAGECAQKQVSLVAVSKTKPASDIQELYNLGHRDFGENYVQELVEKEAQLPKDIRWHFIGHLQSNKVKYIAPFVHLIHGVDSLKLLKEIDKQAAKNNRIISCLLQVYIAKEETKFGMDETELNETIAAIPSLSHVKIEGLMGMASFTDNTEVIRSEFRCLKNVFDQLNESSGLTTHDSRLKTLSMGMSADYQIAIEQGSTLVRIGSLLFGERQYNK